MGGKKELVDFHFHSVYSDGSENINGIIEEAKNRGLKALALTDHNNGAGVPEFVEKCREAGIQTLEGVEIYATFPEADWSWDFQRCGPVPDVTILGKKLDWVKFKEYQEMLVKYWLEYFMPETLEKLRSAGLEVPTMSREEMWEQLKDFGIARVFHDIPNNPKNWPKMLEICNHYDPKITIDDIAMQPVRFANRYLYIIGMQAYVLRAPQDWTVKDAIQIAKDMGGTLFAAHPGGEYANWSDEHLNYFIEQGGKGIEVYQYYHSLEQIKKFEELAKKHNLIISGGSDWHGKNGRPTLGAWDKQAAQTPLWVLDQLLERLP